MSEGTAGQWCRMFKDGRRDVHNDERSDRQSVVSDELGSKFWPKICERQFHNFLVNIHKFHAR
jgi:hypothetical protein